MSTLRSLVNFIYLGQAEIEQEHLETFLAAAKELEIKGLSEEVIGSPLALEQTFDTTSEDSNDVFNTIPDVVKDEDEQNPDQIVDTNEFDYGTLDTPFKDLKDRNTCDKCDYKASTAQKLKIHADAIHDGVRYPCNFCQYKATQKWSLNRHIRKHVV